jgi:hypothetical protein
LLELLESCPLVPQLQALLLDRLSLSEDLALPGHEGLSDDTHFLLLLHYLLVLGRLTLHLLQDRQLVCNLAFLVPLKVLIVTFKFRTLLKD